MGLMLAGYQETGNCWGVPELQSVAFAADRPAG